MSGRGDIDHRLRPRDTVTAERGDCLAAIARRRAAIVEAKAARRIDGAAADWFLTLDDTLAEEIGKGLHRKDG